MSKSNFLWRQSLTRIRIHIDPHWLPGSGYALSLRSKAGSGSTLKPMRIRTMYRNEIPLVTIYALELPWWCQMIPFCPRHAPKQKLANSKWRPFTEDCSVCLERLPAIGPGPGRYQPIRSKKSSVVDFLQLHWWISEQEGECFVAIL